MRFGLYLLGSGLGLLAFPAIAAAQNYRQLRPAGVPQNPQGADSSSSDATPMGMVTMGTEAGRQAELSARTDIDTRSIGKRVDRSGGAQPGYFDSATTGTRLNARVLGRIGGRLDTRLTRETGAGVAPRGRPVGGGNGQPQSPSDETDPLGARKKPSQPVQ